MTHLDTQLLQQYVDMLGMEGIEESIRSFHSVMPEYIEELETYAVAKDSGGLRKQAHKIKGACRSLGFKRLALQMEYLEKEAWGWAEVSQNLKAWDQQYQNDTNALALWLREKN